MRVDRIGYGAGTRDFPSTPNVLRVLIGELDAAAASHTVVVIEAEIDDMNPQIFGVADGSTAGRGRARRLLHVDPDEEESAGDAAHRDRRHRPRASD